MNRYISDEIIKEIEDKADVVDLIGGYIKLKRAGNGRFKALCPFHEEKTPSFVVSTDRQMFHCFGCGKGGNVFRFVMDREGVDFPNAVHMVADRYNVTIPETENREHKHSCPEGVDLPNQIDKNRILKLNSDISEFYKNYLVNNQNSPVGVYLANRNLSSEVIESFALGAAPDAWSASLEYLLSRGYTQDEMIAAGVVIVKEETGKVYDRFRNRLMFPIWDEQGRIVAFSARTIELEPQGAKYVNSPETSVFRKSRVLYALSLSRRGIKDKQCAILCEGQLDVIAMHRAGFNNAVAPQGTAFTDQQARMLKRYTEQVYISFDSDSAGLKATLRTIEILLPIGFAIKVVSMPPGNDPDSIFKAQGPAGVTRLIEASLDFFDFILFQLEEEYDKKTPWGQNKIVESMLNYITKIPIKNSVLRSSYSSRLAHSLSLPESAIFQQLKYIKKEGEIRTAKQESYAKNRENSPLSVQNVNVEQPQILYPPTLLKAEALLLELVLTHGVIAKRLSDELPHSMISTSPVGKALNEVIAMTLNGEWEYAEAKLTSNLSLNPSPEISAALTSPGIHSDDKEKIHEMQEKALRDCLVKIKKYYADIELKAIMQQIATATGEAKDQLTRDYQTKLKQKLSLSADTVFA